MISWSTAKERGVTRKQWSDAHARASRRKQGIAEVVKPEERPRREFKLKVWPCVRRGEEVGTTHCKACGGKSVELKIFACSLHQECTIDRLGDKIGPHCCKTCGDRKAP